MGWRRPGSLTPHLINHRDASVRTFPNPKHDTRFQRTKPPVFILNFEKDGTLHVAKSVSITIES